VKDELFRERYGMSRLGAAAPGKLPGKLIGNKLMAHRELKSWPNLNTCSI